VSWNRKYPRKLWEREYLYHIQSLPQSIIWFEITSMIWFLETI
jgi:hypothetical protein